MSTPLVYQIRIQGHLDETWVHWFPTLEVANDDNGETVLTGEMRDQAELHGLLDRVFDLNLTLLSVSPIKEASL
jgi:hypothetical protein